MQYFPGQYVDREDDIPVNNKGGEAPPAKRDTGSHIHSFIKAPAPIVGNTPTHFVHPNHQYGHRLTPPYHHHKKRKTFKFALPTFSLGLKKFEISFQNIDKKK